MMNYKMNVFNLCSKGAVLGLCLSILGVAEAAPSPMTDACFIEASQTYGIHPDVMLAFLMVEGGTVGQNSRKNRDGSYDIGLFQINTIHLKTLAQFGITEEELRNDGCLNARVAAWHIARVVTPEVMEGIETEEEYLSALARYHSVTPKHNKVYAGLLKKAFDRMYAAEGI